MNSAFARAGGSFARMDWRLTCADEAVGAADESETWGAGAAEDTGITWRIVKGLEEDIDGILGTLARMYALRGNREMVALLAKSEARLEQVDFDNWNGGTYGYQLQVVAPVSVYLKFKSVEAVEAELKEALEPLMKPYANEYIRSVALVPPAHPDKDWRDNAVRWLDRSERRPDGKDFDAFVCHATEDKADVATPLAEALVARGLSIWYDEFQMKVGDGLRRSIDKGLARSRWGIVVLSPAFFEKQWPQYELDGLVALQNGDRKVILPIWHNVDREDVAKFSPPLADKIALRTAKLGVPQLVESLLDVIVEKK